MSREASGYDKSGHKLDSVYDRNGIGQNIDDTGMDLDDVCIPEDREVHAGFLQGLVQDARRRFRIEHATLHEGFGRHIALSRATGPWLKRTGESGTQVCAFVLQGRKELPEKAQVLKGECNLRQTAMREYDAAIVATAEGIGACANARLRYRALNGKICHGIDHAELRQSNSGTLEQDTRPDSARKNDCLGINFAMFGNDTTDTASLACKGMHRTSFHDASTGICCSVRKGSRGLEGFGAAILRSIQPPDHRLRKSMNESADLLCTQETNVISSFPCMTFEPAKTPIEIAFRATKIENAARYESGLDAMIHCQMRPEGKSATGKRKLTWIPTHASDPAPVATGLFTTYPALFKEKDGKATTSEKEGAGSTNDTASNDGDIDVFRQRGQRMISLGGRGWQGWHDGNGPMRGEIRFLDVALGGALPSRDL